MELAVIMYISLVGLFLLGLAMIRVNKSILKLKQIKEDTSRIVVMEMNSKVEDLKSLKRVSQQEYERYSDRLIQDMVKDFAIEIVKNSVKVEVSPSMVYDSMSQPMVDVKMTMQVVKN